MKREQILVAILLTGVGALANGQVIVSSNEYYAYANLIDTNNTVLASNSDSGTQLGGASVSTSISGTRSDYGVTTLHFGESAGSFSAGAGGMNGSASAHSRTTYISGGNSFIGQATDSGFGNTVKFTVGSTQQYTASLNGIITAFHRAYEPSGPVGSFFYIFRLFSSDQGYLFNSQVQNSSTLSNVPFTQTVTLNPGVNYDLIFIGACNAVTVNFASQQAGSGAFGETAFNGTYSLQVVPEPATIAFLGTGLAAVVARRRMNR